MNRTKRHLALLLLWTLTATAAVAVPRPENWTDGVHIYEVRGDYQAGYSYRNSPDYYMTSYSTAEGCVVDSLDADTSFRLPDGIQPGFLVRTLPTDREPRVMVFYDHEGQPVALWKKARDENEMQLMRRTDSLTMIRCAVLNMAQDDIRFLPDVKYKDSWLMHVQSGSCHVLIDFSSGVKVYSAVYNKTHRTWKRGKLQRRSKFGSLDSIRPDDEIPFLDILLRYLPQDAVSQFLKSYEESSRRKMK